MRRPLLDRARSLVVVPLLLAAGCAVLAAQGTERSVRIDADAIDREVQSLLKDHGEGIVAGIWVGGVEGAPWYEWKSGVTYPTASAIKTAYLIELFAAHAQDLDGPLPGLAEVLGDDGHPALAPFGPEARVEIRRELGGASARRIGAIMMGQARASNAVYNAAANVTTAVLGGPSDLAAKIRARDPEFGPIQVRRYMLAPRDRPGDNEATAAALAAVLRRIASGRRRGIDDATLAAIRGAIRHNDDPPLGTRFTKGGSLDSEPITRVESGWWETKQGPIISVVMTVQLGTGPRPRAKAGKRLAEAADRLNRAVVTRVFNGSPGLAAP